MKRVLLVEDLPQVAEHLKGLLAREKEVQLAGVQASGDAAVTQATSEKPEVVIVDYFLGKKETVGLDVAKRIRAASPGTRIVMVTVPQKPVTPRPQEGIDAVFVLPGGANELSQLLGAPPKEGGKGQVIAVYSPKGDTGRTFVAINLASVLRREGKTVALLEGVLQFGTIRHLLDVPPETKSVVDLPPAGAMRTALPEMLWEGPGGVHYLLAPPRPEQADLVSASELPSAVTFLAQQHDHVIIDMPPRLAEDALAFLDAADLILLVVTYSPPTLATARAAIETFDMLGYRGKKPIMAVVNQADESFGMSRGALEHTLGLPIAGEIPSDRKRVVDAQNRKMPLVLADPSAPVSQAFGALANSLVAQQRK